MISLPCINPRRWYLVDLRREGRLRNAASTSAFSLPLINVFSGRKNRWVHSCRDKENGKWKFAWKYGAMLNPNDKRDEFPSCFVLSEINPRLYPPLSAKHTNVFDVFSRYRPEIVDYNFRTHPLFGIKSTRSRCDKNQILWAKALSETPFSIEPSSEMKDERRRKVCTTNSK